MHAAAKLKPTTFMTTKPRRPQPRVDRTRLEHRADGQLWATKGTESRAVTVHRCFPWSDPDRFISLRDHERAEFVFVADPETLDAESQAALRRGLLTSGFVFEVERILEVEDEIEIRQWRVVTRQGPRVFQSGRDTWPRHLPGGGVLIRDVAGDLYHVADPEALDPQSRKLLWVYAE